MKTNKPRRGRPRLKPDETKSVSILLRMQPVEKDGFQHAAKVAGVPLAVWMRERLRKAAVQELEEMHQPVAFLQNSGSR